MEYDAIVIGGGFAGSAAALLLRRECADRKILIVDRSREFTRKVGESATELCSWFLTQVLELDRHLALEHLPKYGLRFWFSNDSVRGLEDASELGNRYQSRVPGMHVERAALDRHVLGLAEAEGVEVLRPETVAEIDLGDPSTITLGSGRTITAKWVIDATGRRAMLARKLDLLRAMPEHPVRAEWSHFRDIKDFDQDRLPGAKCSRGLSTNHLTGYGWWVWLIPLPGGEVSVGLVWDERLTERPDWESTPVAREILEGATCVSEKSALKHLPYKVEQHMGQGWALVGDAAGFLDPLYSPGLDYAAMTVTRTTQLIARQLRGEDIGPCIDRHNRHFRKGFTRWFKALFQDKYYYLGDFELMRIALRLDTAGYYIGVVRPAYMHGAKAVPISFGTGASLPFYWFMRFIHRRMVKLAKRRRGHQPRNAGRRDLLPGFHLGLSTLRYFPWALGALLKMEVKTLWRRVFKRPSDA